ncbi:MAG: nuclear transport factor 2 family protein, partial [Acidobacteria bacterium]|nr:nuclear transport factor 2 family protein [Acidobacteriota bacterium]
MSTYRGRGSLVTLALSILILAILAGAQVGSPQKEIEALYAKLDAATHARDPSVKKDLLAPDYSEKKPDGALVTRAQAIATLEKDSADPDAPDITSATKVDSVGPGKDANEVSVETTVDAVMVGKMNGFAQRLHFNAKIHDIWVHSDAGWKLRYSEAKNVTVVNDGSAWIDYRSEDGRYTVAFPNPPRVDTGKTNDGETLFRAVSLGGVVSYSVQYFDLAGDSDISPDELAAASGGATSTIIDRRSVTAGGIVWSQVVSEKKDASGDT